MSPNLHDILISQAVPPSSCRANEKKKTLDIPLSPSFNNILDSNELDDAFLDLPLNGASPDDEDFIKALLDPIEASFPKSAASDSQNVRSTTNDSKISTRTSQHGYQSCNTACGALPLNQIKFPCAPIAASYHPHDMIPVPLTGMELWPMNMQLRPCFVHQETKPLQLYQTYNSIYDVPVVMQETPRAVDRPKRRIDSWDPSEHAQSNVENQKRQKQKNHPLVDKHEALTIKTCFDGETKGRDRNKSLRVELLDSKRSHSFRGVSLHRLTRRWEASLWLAGKQLYLGGFEQQEDAARAYDLAALACKGNAAITNFPAEEYEEQLKELEGFTKEEVVAYVRRRSAAFARGRSKYRGVSGHDGRWEARIGTFRGRKNMSFGIFDSEDGAARQYDRALIIEKGKAAKTNFPLREYDKEAIEYARWMQLQLQSLQGPAIAEAIQSYILPLDREPTVEEKRRGAIIFGHDIWRALRG